MPQEAQTSLINSLILRMAELSPSVGEALDLESYREISLKDEVTPKSILSDLLGKFFEDIESVGVVIEFDEEDYATDYGLLANLISLGELLLPHGLYQLMKTNSKIRMVIQHVVDGSLNAHETAIETYLTQVAGSEGSPPILPEIAEYLDSVIPLLSQTDLFRDYLENMCDLLDTERPAVEADASRHRDYNQITKDMIVKLTRAMSQVHPGEMPPELLHVFKVIVHDLKASDNFIDYAYMMLEKPDTLPPELIPGWERMWFRYRVSHRWCYEYYPTRAMEPTGIFPDVILCAEYMLCDSPSAYLTRTELVAQKYSRHSLRTKIASLYEEG